MAALYCILTMNINLFNDVISTVKVTYRRMVREDESVRYELERIGHKATVTCPKKLFRPSAGQTEKIANNCRQGRLYIDQILVKRLAA